MDFLIFCKWGTDWTENIKNKNAPPSIITIMIDLPLNGADPGNVPLYGNGDS